MFIDHLHQASKPLKSAHLASESPTGKANTESPVKQNFYLASNIPLNYFTADTAFHAVLVNSLCTGSKFGLTAPWDALRVFAVNFSTKDWQQHYDQDHLITTIRLKYAIAEVNVTEQQWKFCFLILFQLGCKAGLLSAFQGSFTFWFLYDNE